VKLLVASGGDLGISCAGRKISDTLADSFGAKVAKEIMEAADSFETQMLADQVLIVWR
jgi:hypothetical protein